MHIPVIENIDQLATTSARRDALRILEAGYESVLTDIVLREEVTLRGNDICIKDRNICLTDFERIFFVGIGKCAVDASLVFEEILGERLTAGIVLDVKSGVFKRMKSIVGSHPFPSEANVGATKEIVDMLTGLSDRDLVLTVISGGGSSLLCLPHEMNCETLTGIVQALWEKGADIHEVNTIRKHTSEIQGGQLAKIAYPATVVSFVFSDVPGNDLSVIASGPTVMDTTTVEDAEEILARYDVLTMCRLPDCQLLETPKDPKFFSRVTNILLVTNDKALDAMRTTAEILGYHAEIRATALEGIAAERGKQFARMELSPKTCAIYGGETTVIIKGDGEGGRSQELALSALQYITDDRVVVATSSDGWDNTDVAGAITDIGDRARAGSAGLVIDAFLAHNDSYRFWMTLGGALKTGRTGINVADFIVVLRP